MPKTPVWAHLASSEQVTRLIRHAANANGLNPHQIVELLNRRYKTTLFTRNIVVGIAWREKIDIPARSYTVRDGKKVESITRGQRAPRIAPVTQPYDPPAGSIHIVDVEDGQCRYVMFPGIAGKITYDRAYVCGRPVKGSSSYCKHHDAICFEAPEARTATKAKRDPRVKALLQWME